MSTDQRIFLGGKKREIMEQRRYVKKDGCDGLMKGRESSLPRSQNELQSGTNAEKSAYLPNRGLP